jgi:chemotaxis protein histidine kinase CheA
MDKLDPEAQLRVQLAQLAEQFLQRTRNEAALLGTMIERLDSGDSTALLELNHLTHKIHGSAATFGFTSISDCARDMEELIARIMRRDEPAAPDTVSKDLRYLMSYRQLLAQEVETAALRAAETREEPLRL